MRRNSRTSTLKIFEDEALNTPGLSASSGTVTSPELNGNRVDSVDGDDGVIDGSGIAGHDFWSGFPSVSEITFSFDASVLGGLPTHAGLVFTDMSPTSGSAATLTALDSDGDVLGEVGPVILGDDGSNFGGTAEDRFLGLSHSDGIAAIRFSAPNSNAFQLDHVQYGLRESAAEPGLSNWTIYLDQNQNSIRDVGERFTITDENGDYEFTGLPEGTYYVREEQQPGWRQTSPGPNDAAEFFGPIPYLGRADSPFVPGEFDRFFLEDFEDGEQNIPGVSFDFARDFGVSSGLNIFVQSFGSIDNVDEDDGVIDGRGDMGGTLSLLGNPRGGASQGVEFTFDANELGDLPTHAGIVWTDGSPGETIIFEALDAAGQVILSEREEGIGDRSFAGTTAEDRFFGVSYVAGISAFRVYGEQLGRNAFEVDHLQIGFSADIGQHVVELDDNEIVTDRDFGNVQVDTLNNQPPSFTTSPPTQITVGELLRYDAHATDYENDSLTYELVSGPAGMTINPGTGTVVWLPTSGQLGHSDVLLRVTDANQRTDVQSFAVEVVPYNTAPVVTSVGPTQAIADSPLSYQIAAQDAEGDALTFVKTTGPAGLAVGEVTGLVTWTPSDGDVGVQHTASILVSDGRGGETVHDLQISVLATADNTAPEIGSSPRTVARLGSLYLYRVEASDTDFDPLTYTLNNGPAGMAFGPVQIDGEVVNLADNVLSWIPTADQLDGNHPITISVTDGHGGEDEQSFTIQVRGSDVNSTPVIVSTPVTRARQDRLYSYDLQAEDADNDAVTWRMVEGPLGMTIDPDRGTLRWTPTLQQVGLNEVVISATDPFNEKATQRFTIEVTCVNGSPMIHSTPPTEAFSGSPYFYPVRATDPDGDQLVYSFGNADSLPDGLSINANGLIRWNPTVGEIGSLDIVIVATDSEGAFATQQYTVVVEPATDGEGNPNSNQPPQIRSTPTFAAEVGQLYDYTVIATDPEGETVTFELANAATAPVDLNLNETTGRLTWTPTADQVGDQVVAILAKDPDGGISSQAFTIAVRENLPPEIRSSAPTQVAAGGTYRYDVRAVDPEGDPLTFALDGAPAGMTIDRLGRILWDAPVVAVAPTPISVTVTDNRGQSATEDFTINVIPGSSGSQCTDPGPCR